MGATATSVLCTTTVHICVPRWGVGVASGQGRPQTSCWQQDPSNGIGLAAPPPPSFKSTKNWLKWPFAKQSAAASGTDSNNKVVTLLMSSQGNDRDGESSVFMRILLF